MRFSILTPVFNRDWSIGRAIESVLGQTYPNWNLLLCDDGSTDRTRFKVAEYLGDPRISLWVNPQNLGAYPSRNRLLDQARGDIILFLDSDDLLLPEALETYRAFFESQPRVDIAVSPFEDEVNGVLTEIHPKKIRRHICPGRPQDPFGEGQIEEMISATPDWEGCLTLCQAAFRAKCFESYRFPGERPVAEDRDLFRRALASGYKFGYLDRVTYSYRIHPGSLHVSSPRHTFEKSPLGIILPYRRREYLLRVLLDRIEKPNWAALYLVEEDQKESLPQDLKRRLDGYLFQPSDQAFSRSNCFNRGFATWNHPYYLLHNLDLIPQPGFWEKIRTSLETTSVTLLFPWDRILYLSEPESQNFLAGRPFSGKTSDRPVGGSILVEREFYLKVGGMNSDMVGCGPDGYEFLERCKWVPFPSEPPRLHNQLVHLWHGEDPLNPPRSKLESPDYKRNCEIYRLVKNLPIDQRIPFQERMRRKLLPIGASGPHRCYIFLTTGLQPPPGLPQGTKTVYLEPSSDYWNHLEAISDQGENPLAGLSRTPPSSGLGDSKR